MRIIDNKHDFYDYLQDPVDNLVFDRRNSYDLTKDMMCTALNVTGLYRNTSYRFALLQCCHTFWLFLIKTYKQKLIYQATDSIYDYDIELLTTWRNYDLPRKLIELNIIDFRYFHIYDYNKQDYNYDKIIENIDKFKDAVNHKNISFEYCLTKNNIKEVSKKIKHKTIIEKEIRVPILKATKIGTIVDPRDIFYSIEEYFSLEKSDSERIEPIGATNDDKIVMHGFDTKVSFRG